MTMGRPPWDTFTDKSLVCEGAANRGDLGVHTKYSCLSHVDIGLEYGWYRGVNVAVWRGDTNKHCYLCTLTGNSSSWDFKNTKGAVVYALPQGYEVQDKIVEDENNGDFGGEYVHTIRTDDEALVRFNKHMEKTRKMEMGEDLEPPSSGLDLHSTGNPMYTLKSTNFGANWTWIMLPQFLQGLHTYAVDPTNTTTNMPSAPTPAPTPAPSSGNGTITPAPTPAPFLAPTPAPTPASNGTGNALTAGAPCDASSWKVFLLGFLAMLSSLNIQ